MPHDAMTYVNTWGADATSRASPPASSLHPRSTTMVALVLPPHVSTILILNLPPASHVGLDFVSFSATSTFRGVKLVPPGLHHIWVSPAPLLFLRHSFWIECIPGSIHVFSYSSETESLVPEGDLPPADVLTAKASINAELWNRGLYAYRQRDAATGVETHSDAVWRDFVQHVDAAVLRRVYGGERWSADTASMSAADNDDAENEMLLRAVQIPRGGVMVGGTDGVEEEKEEEAVPKEHVLEFAQIDLKRTWPPDAVGRQRTTWAKDYSWRLEETLRMLESPGALLGQWEVACVLASLVANYSAGRFWMMVSRLVLGCREAVKSRAGFFCECIEVLKTALVLVDKGEDGGWLQPELPTLEKLLRQFGDTLRQESVDGEVLDKFKELEKWARSKFDWILDNRNVVRRGMMQTEDGDMVELELEGAEEEDETGEYAPVIVEGILDVPPLEPREEGLSEEVVDSPEKDEDIVELERQLAMGDEGDDSRY